MALGLGLVAVAFTILNTLLFRVDAVPDVHEMFAVERPRTADGERERFTRAQFDALRRETSVFTDAYAEVSQVDSRVDGRMMCGTFVTGNFFQVLGVSAAMGRALTPADDEPSAGRTGDGAQPPRMGPAVRARPGHSRSPPARQWGHVRDRRRDARGISRTDRRTRRLLGAALDARSGSPDPSRAAKRMSVVDIIGRLKPGMSRQTALAGLAVWDAAPVDRQSDRARRLEHHARTEARAPSRSLLKRCS